MTFVVVAKSHNAGEWHSAKNPEMSFTKAVTLYNNGLGLIAQRKVDRTSGKEKYELVFKEYEFPKRTPSWKLRAPLGESS